MIKKPQSRYLKAGQGKLVSEYHGETNFSKKRKEKIIKEQEEREKEAKGKEFGWCKINIPVKYVKPPISWNIN